MNSSIAKEEINYWFTLSSKIDGQKRLVVVPEYDSMLCLNTTACGA